MSNTDTRDRDTPARTPDEGHVGCDTRLGWLSQNTNYWSQTPLRPSTKVAGKPATGRGKVGTYPRAGQGPVWAVPEESVDDGGAVSVTVTVTVDVTVSVDVTGGVVTVTGAGS